MIIEFNIKNNFYDDLENQFYGSNPNSCVMYNFIPVKILEEYYILTSLKNLECYLLEYKENITVKLYIGNIVTFLKINSVISFTEKNYNPSEKYDCYIDSISNLILIKFKYEDLNYIKIDNNMNPEIDLFTNQQDILLTYIWTDNNLKNNKITRKSKLRFVWENKYINLPEIPYILDIPNINKKLNPLSGSGVFNTYGFMGMVSYINESEIIITPLITIKKLAKYLEGEIILFLGLDLYPVHFDFKSELNKINFDYGLLIGNNFYDIYKKINKSKKKLIYNNQNSDNNINDTIGNNDMYINILEKNNNEFDKKQIISEEKQIILEEKQIILEEKQIILEEKQIISEKKDELYNYKTNDEININSDEFYDINTRNSTIEKLILDRENKKCLSKKNILCLVDNYKINSLGQIIISDNKTIPFKSYLWLFKSIDNNNLNLSVIPNYVYNINLIELNNGKILLTDSYLKKKILIIETIIYLDSNYDSISSFNSSEIKYIKYKNNIICELNEKILFILKKIIMFKPYLYQKVFSRIFSNRFNHNDSKILIGINFDNELPKLTIVNNYKNFNSIIKKYRTSKELKRFVMSNIIDKV